MNETAIVELAETAAGLVGQIVPDCEGACLGTSAILAYVLGAHGVQTSVVRGEYDEHSHWWLQTDTLRIDATRGQFFDGGELVEPLDHGRDEDPYVVEQAFPSGWDRDLAVAEFARMFEYGYIGKHHGHDVLAALEDMAATLRQPVLAGKEA